MEALDHIYFIGLQEAYETSVKFLIREFNVSMVAPTLKERDQSNKQTTEQKAKLKANAALMQHVKDLNSFDADLYQFGKLWMS